MEIQGARDQTAIRLIIQGLAASSQHSFDPGDGHAMLFAYRIVVTLPPGGMHATLRSATIARNTNNANGPPSQ